MRRDVSSLSHAAERLSGRFKEDEELEKEEEFSVKIYGKYHIAKPDPTTCDLYHKPKDPEMEAEKIRKKYRGPKFKTKGWSEAKIERAISDSIATLKPRRNGLSLSLRVALCDIAAQARNLSLVVHYYSGGVETETFGILEKKKVRCAELLNDDWAIEEDKVIEIK